MNYITFVNDFTATCQKLQVTQPNLERFSQVDDYCINKILINKSVLRDDILKISLHHAHQFNLLHPLSCVSTLESILK